MNKPAQVHKLKTPDTVRYQLLERIGRGTSGEVFLGEAHATRLGERWPVAIKVLAGVREPMDDMLRHEAHRLKDLRYPLVLAPTETVRLHEPDGSWAVVMDYVPGADLRQIMRVLAARRDPLPVRVIFQIAMGILDALAAAHGAPGRSIPHRSLTPADIRLSPRGELVVVDFAVHRHARVVDVPWCPPEHREPDPRGPSPAGDVYAAAAIALWLLVDDGDTWVPPLHQHDAHIDARIVRATALLGSSLAGRTATALLRLALSSEPEARPQARALAEALRDVTRSLPGEDLSTFAARIVPVAASPKSSEEETLQRLVALQARPRFQLPAGFPEVGLAVALTMAPLVLLVLLGMLVFTWSLYVQAQLQQLPPPAPLEQPASVPPQAPAPTHGFRQDL